MHQEREAASPAVVMRTWWPLAASWLLMAAEAPLLAAVVARLPDPLVNLAAYGGVVFPLALIIESPVVMLLAASTALSRDRPTYCRVRQYMLWSGGLLTALHLAVALTPLYDLVVVRALGADPTLVEPARIGLLLMTPWTWSIAYRRFNQGALIRHNRSRAVSVGTVVRLSSMAAVLAIGYGLRLRGIVVGTSAVACGVMAEALYTRVAVQPVLRGPLARDPDGQPTLTWHAFFDFYVPLALTSLLLFLAQPIGSAAMSRMPQPVASLAAWQVTSSLLFLLRSPGVAFNEVVVALIDQPRGEESLRRFAWALIGGVAVLGLLFAVTPLAEVWFGRLMDLDKPLVEMARRAMLLGLPIAVLTVAQSWFQGRLVARRRTRGVSEAVALYLAVDAAVLAAGVAIGSSVGLHVAVVAMSVAGSVQVLWLWHRDRAFGRGPGPTAH